MNRLRLRTKIILLFFIVILATTSALGLLFFSWAKKTITDHAIESHRYILTQIAQNIAAFQNNIWNISALLVFNPEKYASYTGVREVFAVQKQLSMLAIFSAGRNEGERYFRDTSAGLVSFSDFKQTPLYHKIIEAKGRPIWTVFSRSDTSVIALPRTDRIVMARALLDVRSSFEETGIIMLGAPLEILEDLCGVKNIPLNNMVMITDVDGQLLYRFGADLVGAEELGEIQWGNGYASLPSGGGNVLLFRNTTNPDGWHVYLAMEKNSLYPRLIFSVLMGGALTIAAVLLIALLAICWIADFFTKPITRLIASMDDLGSGAWDHHVALTSHDEIGELGRHYNDMIDNLRKLVDANYVLALREREAELNNLQAQINPHFLYNTLAVLYAMSVRAGQDELGELVLALSDIFRTSLNKGDAWITVQKEKDFLKHYLAIQKKRNDGRLDYSIDIEPRLLPYLVPKLIVQPFVENAVVHGLFQSARGGKVEITGRLVEGRIVFTVNDDGVGVDQEALEQIRHMPDEKPSSVQGYALWNVRERLRLYYHGDFSITYESEPGKGMRIRMEMPSERHGLTKPDAKPK